MANRDVRDEILSRLSDPVRAHLRRLRRSTGMLADLSMADVLVVIPNNAGDEFIVVNHRRPINARTLYDEDQVGVALSAASRPLMAHAYRTGEITDGGVLLPEQGWIRTLAVPVRFQDDIVAVFVREFSPSIDEIAGELLIVQFAVLRRMAQMIADGVYPYAAETREHDHPPRIGDGLMLLDAHGQIEYASPNATTVLRILGVDEVPVGRSLHELGVDLTTVSNAYSNRLLYTGEYSWQGRSMSIVCYPLIENDSLTGALTVVRDISELRDRDRLLLTKDATINEIHHRVKNNLQTISSLLRLQARRLESNETRTALEEAVRRIRSIAVVHEILSHRSGDEVPFSEVAQTLMQVVRDALVEPSRPIDFTVESSDTVLPAAMTTSLAVVLSELLQNTIDHAFPSDSPGPREVTVNFRVQSDVVELSVSDTGIGFPTDFELNDAGGLGLTIVRTLVESELRGTIEIERSSNHERSSELNRVTLRLPVRPSGSDDPALQPTTIVDGI